MSLLFVTQLLKFSYTTTKKNKKKKKHKKPQDATAAVGAFWDDLHILQVEDHPEDLLSHEFGP